MDGVEGFPLNQDQQHIVEGLLTMRYAQRRDHVAVADAVLKCKGGKWADDMTEEDIKKTVKEFRDARWKESVKAAERWEEMVQKLGYIPDKMDSRDLEKFLAERKKKIKKKKVQKKKDKKE